MHTHCNERLLPNESYFTTIPAVGFQLVEATVQEARARIFTCVQLLFSDGPLESEVQVEFYTQDGSAEGIAILMFGHFLQYSSICVLH